MSITRTTNRWLNRLYKTVAILLVLLAVLISAFRLLLPYVHHYKLPLQNYINEQAQTHIAIGELSMTWQRFGPVLVIGEAKILATGSATIYIEQLELQVDFWRTLTTQELISKNLTISGAKVKVSEGLWLTETTEEGLKSEQSEQEISDISAISDLFLNRIKRFSIRDSELTIHNKTITRNIRLNRLNWLNTGDRHQAQGSVVLNELSSNNLQLKLDLTGEHGSELAGQVYLQANHIDITPWLDKVLVLDDDKTKTDINFAAWLRVRESEINRLHIDFFDSSMHWQHEKSQQKLTIEEGQLLLVKRKRERSFNLYSTELALRLNDNPAEKFTIMLAKDKDDFSAHFSDVDVNMFTYLTPLIISNPKTRQSINDLELTGKIEDLYLRNEDNNLQAIAKFSAFNNRYSQGIPGIKNVEGTLSFSDNYLAIEFDAKSGELDFDNLFVQAFPYQQLAGKLNVTIGEKDWSLAVESLDFYSEEINLSAQVRVDAPANGEVELALLAHVSNGNAGLVGRYLPLPIMSESLIEYLNNAVVSGRIEDAQVLINGPINHFPFDDGSGIFVVDAELSQSEFKFVENWPSITDFVANLNFTNNSMLITGRGGQLTGLDMKGVTAGIADLAGAGVLVVDADIKPTAAVHIRNLMQNSPLKDTVGSTLEHLDIMGEVSGKFNLTVPLNDSDSSLAQGNILFNNNSMNLQAPKMHFNNVQGQLNFSNDKVTTQALRLKWQGLPINIDINAANKQGYYATDLNMSADWGADQWIKYVPQQLQPYISGGFPWEGKLSLYNHHQGGFSYKAAFVSDLHNTALELPFPYKKTTTEIGRLTVNIDGQADNAKIVADYNQNLSFSGTLNHDTATMNRANLLLGENMMPMVGDGFHISTKLAEVEFSQWQPLIGDILEVINEPKTEIVDVETPPFLTKPENIRGSIGQLSVLGQKLNNVSFNLLDKSQFWLLQLNADETRSQISIYPDWVKQGIDINSEFLLLAVQDDTDQVSQMNHPVDRAKNDEIFANIPPLLFYCASCSVGSLDLGQVDLNVKRIDDQTIEFTSFKAARDDAEILLSGRWLHNESESNTAIAGSVSIDDLESELKALSFASIVKDSGVEMAVDFNWAGGVHDFDMTQLNGNVKAKVDDGYLADVPDTARIFSVLSLQSLVRKLTLDFRDIFSDGMFYSSITGDYRFEGGVLTTNNTEMAGTAGDLFMTGHTNLISGVLDYDMVYKPNLTSSLPVLAWIATLNPVTFLAGVAIDQVIKSQVVSEFNFELTGTVDDPKFLEVNRKNQDVSIENNVPVQSDELKAPIDEQPPVIEKSPKSEVEHG